MRYLILLPLLTSCGLFTKTIPTPYPVYHRIDCGAPAKPKGIKPYKVQPYVVETPDGTTWVAFSPEDYRNMALNTRETIRYIKDQNGVVQVYVKCVEDFNASLDELEASKKE